MELGSGSGLRVRARVSICSVRACPGIGGMPGVDICSLDMAGLICTRLPG